MDRRRVAIVLAGSLATIAGTDVASAADEPAGAVAAAPGFGKRETVILSIENVFGIMSEEIYESGKNGSLSTDSKGFLVSGNFGLRAGVHGVLGSGITLGTGLGFEAFKNTERDSSSTVSLYRIAPRVGYAGSIDSKLGFWLRTGPTISILKESSETLTFWDWSIDVFGVWTPVEHFGLLVGPTFDIAFAGNASPDNGPSDSDIRYKSFGFFIGMFADF
jgi:hypothetical protein